MVLPDGQHPASRRAAASPLHGFVDNGVARQIDSVLCATVQRSAAVVLEVLDRLKMNKPIMVGYSCAGQVLSVLGAQDSERLGGLVYFDAADDPTLTPAEYDIPFPDPAQLPPSIKPAPAPDYRSFEAYRLAERRDHVAFPEAELRQLFAANADGSSAPHDWIPRFAEPSRNRE
jgi:pimeloyl-ACP methyl ester carboxylesterase